MKITLLGAGHKQCPAFDSRIKFDSMIASGFTNTKMSGTTPMLEFGNLLTFGIENRSPFPIAAFEN